MGNYIKWTYEGCPDHLLVQTHPVYIRDVQKEFVDQGYYVFNVYRIEGDSNIVFIEFYKEKEK